MQPLPWGDTVRFVAEEWPWLRRRDNWVAIFWHGIIGVQAWPWRQELLQGPPESQGSRGPCDPASQLRATIFPLWCGGWLGGNWVTQARKSVPFNFVSQDCCASAGPPRRTPPPSQRPRGPHSRPPRHQLSSGLARLKTTRNARTQWEAA